MCQENMVHRDKNNFQAKKIGQVTCILHQLWFLLQPLGCLSDNTKFNQCWQKHSVLVPASLPQFDCFSTNKLNTWNSVCVLITWDFSGEKNCIYVHAAVLSTPSCDAEAVIEVCGNRDTLQLTRKCLLTPNVKQKSFCPTNRLPTQCGNCFHWYKSCWLLFFV